MLLFISYVHAVTFLLCHFNTSHVTVYLLRSLNTRSVRSDFNTSHVTVYQFPYYYDPAKATFQYISCYCLSKDGRNHMQKYQHFNTSHVTVYPVWMRYCKLWITISIHLMLLFIENPMHSQ